MTTITCRICNENKPKPSKGGLICQPCLNRRKRGAITLQDVPKGYRCETCGYMITVRPCVLCNAMKAKHAKEA